MPRDERKHQKALMKKRSKQKAASLHKSHQPDFASLSASGIIRRARAFPFYECWISDNWQKEVEQSDQPVVVDFWAPWCGPCRTLGPTIDKIATQFDGKVKVGKLNVDDSPDVATKYGVNSIPRVFFFKGGDTPRKTIVGLVSENELVKTINGLLEA